MRGLARLGWAWLGEARRGLQRCVVGGGGGDGSGGGGGGGSCSGGSYEVLAGEGWDRHAARPE